MNPTLFHSVLRVFAAAFGAVATLALAGCISFTLEVPGEPLSPDQLRARIETRQYAADFIERVARAADIIADGTEDAGIRANTLRWKIGASVASRRAAYRYEPQLALVDTWAFALQMEYFFGEGAGRALFGSQQQTALDTARALAREADALAARGLDAGVLADYRKLVSDYAARERLSDLSFKRASIGPLWREAAARDESVQKPVDAGSEVRADASDRLDIYGQRIPDELRWRAELAYVESGFQPGDLSRALKRIEEDFAKLSTFSQTQPELIMERLAAMQAEMGRVAENFDRRWGQTLTMLQVERATLVKDLEAMRLALDATIERERQALYAAISAERAALAADAARIGKELGPLLLAKLGEIVTETLLLLILLVLILIGLPFASGFLTGRAMTRRSQPTEAPFSK
jgi:hypothetical protein